MAATSPKKFALPGWLPRAVSVSLALTIFITVGEMLKLQVQKTNAQLGQQLFTGAKWAGITCAVVAGPVTGGVANTCKERVIGTIAGGLTGYAVYWVNHTASSGEPVELLPTSLLMGVTAGTIGWLGVWGGNLLKLNYSAKLFTISFLLVFSGASSPEQAKFILLTRICGICVGVFVTLLFAVTILPTTAHDNMLAGIHETLTGLLELDELSWMQIRGRLFPASARAAASAATAAAAAADAAASAASLHIATADAESEAKIKNPVMTPEEGEIAAERSVVKVYNAIEKVKLALPLAHNEIYVGRIFGHPFYLPRALLWCFGGYKWRPVPEKEVNEVCRAIRNVARLQLAIYNIFDEGLDQSMMEIVKERYPDVLLPLLVQGTHDCIQDCKTAFPDGDCVPTGNLHQLSLAVESLLRISDYQRRRIANHFQRYKTQAALLKMYLAPLRHSEAAAARPGAHASLSDTTNAVESSAFASAAVAAMAARSRRSGRRLTNVGEDQTNSFLDQTHRELSATLDSGKLDGQTVADVVLSRRKSVMDSMRSKGSDAAASLVAANGATPRTEGASSTPHSDAVVSPSHNDAGAPTVAARSKHLSLLSMTQLPSPTRGQRGPVSSSGSSPRPPAPPRADASALAAAPELLSNVSPRSGLIEPVPLALAEPFPAAGPTRFWQVPQSLLHHEDDAQQALENLPDGLFIQRCSMSGSSPPWVTNGSLFNSAFWARHAAANQSRRESGDPAQALSEAQDEAPLAPPPSMRGPLASADVDQAGFVVQQSTLTDHRIHGSASHEALKPGLLSASCHDPDSDSSVMRREPPAAASAPINSRGITMPAPGRAGSEPAPSLAAPLQDPRVTRIGREARASSSGHGHHHSHSPSQYGRHTHSSLALAPSRTHSPEGSRPDLRMVLPRVETQKMKLFPDTPEGHISEVRWFTFQFDMEELMEELDQLQHSVHSLLKVLPSNPYYRASPARGLSAPLLQS